MHLLNKKMLIIVSKYKKNVISIKRVNVIRFRNVLENALRVNAAIVLINIFSI